MWFVNKNKTKGMPTRRLATKTPKKFVLNRNNNRLWDFVHKRLAFNKLLRKSTSTRSRQPIRSANFSYVKVLQSFSPLLIIVIIIGALWWSGYPQKVSVIVYLSKSLKYLTKKNTFLILIKYNYYNY